MDTLKKIFPLSFKYVDSVANLIIGILIYIVVPFVFGLVSGLVSSIIPILAWIFGILGSIIGLYSLVGIILQILVFAKVLK